MNCWSITWLLRCWSTCGLVIMLEDVDRPGFLGSSDVVINVVVVFSGIRVVSGAVNLIKSLSFRRIGLGCNKHMAKTDLEPRTLGAVDNWFSSHLTANWPLTLDPLPPSLLTAIRGSFL